MNIVKMGGRLFAKESVHYSAMPNIYMFKTGRMLTEG